MKMQAIENPRSIFLKMAYWMTKKQYGKVMTPVKVIYARKPALLSFMQKLFQIDGKKLKITDELKELIRNFAARWNGCAFCEDISRMRGLKSNTEKEKFNQLMNFKESDEFSEREKAALTFVKEVLDKGKAGQETFDRLNYEFSEEQIIDITWVLATENYMNTMNKALDIESDGFCEISQLKNAS